MLHVAYAAKPDKASLSGTEDEAFPSKPGAGLGHGIEPKNSTRLAQNKDSEWWGRLGQCPRLNPHNSEATHNLPSFCSTSSMEFGHCFSGILSPNPCVFRRSNISSLFLPSLQISMIEALT